MDANLSLKSENVHFRFRKKLMRVSEAAGHDGVGTTSVQGFLLVLFLNFAPLPFTSTGRYRNKLNLTDIMFLTKV